MNTSNINLYRFIRGVVAALAVMFAAATSVSAQTSTGTVKGTVTSADGAPANGAQVTARNVESGVLRNTTAREDGSYVLPGVVPGTYEISVRRIGAAPQT